MSVGVEDARAAAARLKGYAIETPLLEAPLLNRAAGRRILLKAENLQRTGSFKFRGAWSHVTGVALDQLRGGVFAASSGNHAQGVACAAQMMDVPATILMPTDAPALKRANVEAYGADVVTYDRAGGRDRDETATQLLARRSLHPIHPYNDDLVLAGQATTGLEIVAQAAAAGVSASDVVACCGGGGLTVGMAIVFAEVAPGLRARTAEPAAFDDWARSLQRGERVANASLSGSICDAILTPTPGDTPWALGSSLLGPGLVVSDLEARRAMAAAFRHLKIVLEPGGAVALAAALFHPDAFAGDAVVVVATGGNVDEADFRRWTDFDRWSAEGLPLSAAA